MTRVPVDVLLYRIKRTASLDLLTPVNTSLGSFDKAYNLYSSQELLRSPFWVNQFALKKSMRERILESYHLVNAQKLKEDCYPSWGASDPLSAMNKRAERNQVLSIMVDGERFYPIEQFEYKAETPKLTSAFNVIIKAFAGNGEISQEEMLYWLSERQPLLLPSDSVVSDAIEHEDLQQGWDALKQAGPSEQLMQRPLDCLLKGDSETALHLFYDWTDTEQDDPPHSREELIAAVKQFMAVERISIQDLTQG